jgi:hypothetical protein
LITEPKIVSIARLSALVSALAFIKYLPPLPRSSEYSHIPIESAVLVIEPVVTLSRPVIVDSSSLITVSISVHEYEIGKDLTYEVFSPNYSQSCISTNGFRYIEIAALYLHLSAIILALFY